MTPFFFGTSSRRLFGIYTPGAANCQRGVVLCPPWGQEYLRAHRSMRHLASLLSRTGLHVMRFDFYGTGDSAGEMRDGDLRGWQSDIAAAVAELQDTSGAIRVGLVGLRLGATLAARAAASKPPGVDSLVLWDPILRGADYLGEVRQLSAAIDDMVPPPRPGEDELLLGFDLTPQLAEEFDAIDLVASMDKLPQRTLVIVSQPAPSFADLAKAAKGAVAMEEITSPPAWLEDKNSGVGAIPLSMLQRIVHWFE